MEMTCKEKNNMKSILDYARSKVYKYKKETN